MSRRAALCVLFAVVTLIGCGPLSAPKPTTSQKAAISRREAEALLIGKTPDEVLAAWGRPDRTDDRDGKPKVWNYREMTVDTVTGKKDSFTAVWFEDNKVQRITY